MGATKPDLFTRQQHDIANMAKAIDILQYLITYPVPLKSRFILSLL